MTMNTLYINEIFTSIQGESTWAGFPCVFVRLKGCPLRCHYCDSSYAFTNGQKMKHEQIVEDISTSGLQLVEITGGEPLIQPNVHTLMTELVNLGYTVLLETSGERDLSCCDERIHRIIDIKTPCSGAEGSFLNTNYEILTKKDEIKFVIMNREDFDWAVDIIKKYDLVESVQAVHFSPVMKQCPNEHIQGCQELNPRDLSRWMIDSGLKAQLHLQIHKYIWPTDARKV